MTISALSRPCVAIIAALAILAPSAVAAILAPPTPVGRTPGASPCVQERPLAVTSHAGEPKKRRRSLTEILRLLEQLREADQNL